MAETRILTNEQFEALATLLRLRPGTAKDAARLMLVAGVRQSEAAERAGTTRQAAHRAMHQVLRGLELAERATNRG